jgi:hypothetical protein
VTRGFLAYNNFQQQKCAVNTITAAWRCIVWRRHYQRQRMASSCLQEWVRAWIVRKKLHDILTAATIITNFSKTFLAKRHLRKTVLCVTKVQSYIRGFLERHQYSAKQKGAVTIGCCWRMWKNSMQYMDQRNAAILLQSQARTRIANKNFSLKCKAVMTINIAYKSFVERTHEQRKRKMVTVEIQRHWRAKLIRIQFKKMCNAGLLLVRFIKTHYTQQRYRNMQQGVILFQSMFRMYSLHWSFKQSKISVNQIAATWRMSRQQQQFHKRRSDAIQIQTIWRAKFLRCRFIAMRKTVCFCQHLWRETHAEKMASIKLTCWWRCIEATRKVELLKQFAEKIRRERELRKQFRCAKIIQRCMRLYHFKKRLHILAGAVRCVQSFVRGVRIRQKNGKKLQKIRKRLLEANRRYTSALSIGVRSNIALTTLLKSKSLTAVINACTTLKMVTQYSRTCSQHFIEHGAMRIIFALMASSNRSEPHRRLIKICLGIVSNLRSWGKLLKSSTSLLQESEMLVLVDLLQSYREKPKISVSALRLFIQGMIACPDLQATFRSNVPVMKRLQSILRLSARKANTRNGKQSGKMYVLMLKIKKLLCLK